MAQYAVFFHGDYDSFMRVVEADSPALALEALDIYCQPAEGTELAVIRLTAQDLGGYAPPRRKEVKKSSINK